MSLMNTFVNEPENLAGNMDVIRNAGRPEKFDKQFLISLGIDESNAVLYKNLFISLGLVGANGQPTTDYGQFIGTREESRSILAEKIWDKYTRLFAEERLIHEKNKSEMAEVFRKVYGKDHSDSFINLLCSTFKALVEYAGIGTEKKQPVEMVAEEIHLNGNGVAAGLDSEKNNVMNVDSDDLFNANENIMDELPGEESDTDKSVEYLMDLITRKPQDPKQDKTVNKEENTMNNDIIERAQTEKRANRSGSSDKFLDKALFKRAELLQKLDRKEEAIEAFDQIVQYLENQYSGTDQKDKISETLIRKAELLEELGNDEKTLEAYEQYIKRFYNQES